MDAIICKIYKGKETEGEIASFKQELNKWNWTNIYNSQNPISLIQVMLDFIESFSIPLIEVGHLASSNNAENSLVIHEKEILKQLAKLCAIFFISTEKIEDRETCLYRIAIALLGLHKREIKCFLNRTLIAENFENSDSIEKMKDYLEKLILDSKEGKKKEEEKEKITINQFQVLLQSIDKLPEKQQSRYVQKFQDLLKDVEKSSNAPTSKIKLIPILMKEEKKEGGVEVKEKIALRNAAETLTPQESKNIIP